MKIVAFFRLFFLKLCLKTHLWPFFLVKTQLKNHVVHVFSVSWKLEHLVVGTPVSWKVNLSQNKFRSNTRTWNTSKLEKKLDLTPIEKMPNLIRKSFFGGSCKNRCTLD